MQRLSVITICYNTPNLTKTCESIINQSWQDFEWIVVDGGSDENTQKIWDKYKYRIDKFVSEPDKGIYNACNKGIKLAQGEYLNFMNAGDSYFYKDVLKDIFKDKTYTSDVLYGNENFIFKDKQYMIETMPKIVTKEFLYFSTLRHQSSFIKRDLFRRYGLYNESYKIVSDYEKWLIFFNNNATFENIPYIIANHLTDGISHDEKNQHLHNLERLDVTDKNFTPAEISSFSQKSMNSLYKKYKNMEKLFSIKNSTDKRYKILTILGIHIKIKRRYR